MTAVLEEARRLLRLARRDQAAFEALLLAPGVGVAVAYFHAQQSAEKALKAVMCLNGLEYRRTHDLEELAGQLEDLGVSPPFSANEWRRLSPYAVEYRYDDEAPELLTPLQARSIVHHVLTWCESQIPAAA